MTGKEIAESYLTRGQCEDMGHAVTYDDDGMLSDCRAHLGSLIDAAIDAAVRAEREACAKIANEYPLPDDLDDSLESKVISTAATGFADRIADAIRARSALYQPQADAANPLFEGGTP